jgi:aminomethyltransferase
MRDDLICYRENEHCYLVCLNASNKQSDLDWFTAHKKNYEVIINSWFDSYSILALQGPKAKDTVSDLGIDIRDFKYYSFRKTDSYYLARTGYTGEDGFEFFLANEQVVGLWRELVQLGAIPCGLAARDVLRIEAGFPLYGNELNLNLTPLDTGLAWITRLDKGDFIGKEFLKNYDPKYRAIKFTLENGIARSGYPISFENMEIGKVTSGTFSPTLKKGIALGLINKELQKDSALLVKIRNDFFPIKTVRDFVKKRGGT